MPKGCILGLIGENGAGKSTVISSLLDTIRHEGEVKLLGEKISADLKNRIGVVFDEMGFHDLVQSFQNHGPPYNHTICFLS